MSSKGGRRRHAEHEEHEEHENHERWLVSYADMMTLLMVLFIVMFAISAVDSQKFAALKHGLEVGFGAPLALLNGGDALLTPGASVSPERVNLDGSATGTSQNQQLNPSVDPDAVAELVNATARAAAAEEADNLKKVRDKLKRNLAQAGLKNGATFRFDERGLVITVATDDVLFDSGSARLRDQGRKILRALAPGLRTIPNRISVDGHTNSIPISTARYPSNWELSADRATGVLRYLVGTCGISRTQVTATAFADTRPLLPKSDPRSVVKNRRVEIIIIAQVDNSGGEAFAKEATDAPTSTTSLGGEVSADPASSEETATGAGTAGSDGH